MSLFEIFKNEVDSNVIEREKSTWSLLLPSKQQNEFIWNYGTIALRKLLPNIGNPFWRDVINAWISFHMPSHCLMSFFAMKTYSTQTERSLKM